MPIKKTKNGKSLINPKSDREIIDYYKEIYSDLEREVSHLRAALENEKIKCNNLLFIIERARINWSKIGANLSLKELVLDIKDGKYKPYYRDEETVSFLNKKLGRENGSNS
jgi:hypothetical protein